MIQAESDIICAFVLTVQVGHMIQAESDNTKRDEYLKRLMSLPNQVWFYHELLHSSCFLLRIVFTMLSCDLI